MRSTLERSGTIDDALPPARWRRIGLAAAIIAAVLSQPAQAHSGGSEQLISVSLDAPSPALPKVKVELQKTLGTQLVVENKSDTPLEIIGTDGVPFLRIGPAGVEANVNARDWYRFYSTAGVAQPERLLQLAKGSQLPAQWKPVSPTPAWGWFDARLNSEGVKVPHRAHDASQPVTLQAWRIPVNYGGKRAMLTGHFQYLPQPQGFHEARLRSSSEIAPGVNLQVLQGPVPGFMIENTGTETITILDGDGKPFIEIAPGGVRANTRSASWKTSGLAESSYSPIPVVAGDGPLWQQRSTTPRLTWLDPRAAAQPLTGSAGASKTGRAPLARQWVIPFVYQGENRRIEGVTQWVSYKAADNTASIASAGMHTRR
jgi:hypothetical protein